MKVSVIVPTYNEENVIEKCLESLSKQTHKDMEVIVVDDGSTDNTVNRLSNYRINLLRQKHKGAAAARNLGAKQAKGEILVFVDADMTFDEDFVKNLIKPIVAGKAIGTFSKEEYVANSEKVWAKCWNINRGLPTNKMHRRDYPDTQEVFRAILRAEFEKAGGFDEKAGYTDDWSLSERLGVLAVSALAAVFYHKNPETLKEVFIQSRWMAKRSYKLGLVGVMIALVRVSFPVSVVIGVYKYFVYLLIPFVLFKLVSDLGQFIGILEFVLLGKVSK